MPDFRRSARGRRQSWYGLKKYVKRALSWRALHPVLRFIGPRLPSLRLGRLPAPASVGEVRGTVEGGTYVLLRPDRCEIAKELYWGSGRRPDPTDALALDVAVALTRDAGTFFDIGAYTGVFTFATTSANPDLQAHAFEIVPAVTNALEANVRRNEVTERVVVHQVGLGEPDTRVRVPAGDNGSALPSFYAADMSFDEGVEVPIVALDNFTDEVSAPVVLKIDVEGGEITVLSHGQQFLAEYTPDILCEVLEGTDIAALTDLLEPHGLGFYQVHDRHLLPRDRLTPENAHRDWLFSTRTPAQLRALGIPVRDG